MKMNLLELINHNNFTINQDEAKKISKLPGSYYQRIETEYNEPTVKSIKIVDNDGTTINLVVK